MKVDDVSTAFTIASDKLIMFDAPMSGGGPGIVDLEIEGEVTGTSIGRVFGSLAYA